MESGSDDSPKTFIGNRMWVFCLEGNVKIFMYTFFSPFYAGYELLTKGYLRLKFSFSPPFVSLTCFLHPLEKYSRFSGSIFEENRFVNIYRGIKIIYVARVYSRVTSSAKSPTAPKFKNVSCLNTNLQPTSRYRLPSLAALLPLAVRSPPLIASTQHQFVCMKSERHSSLGPIYTHFSFKVKRVQSEYSQGLHCIHPHTHNNSQPSGDNYWCKKRKKKIRFTNT